MCSIGHWLASMNSAQQWMLGVLLILVVGRLYQAINAKQAVAEALFNFGGPAVLAAAAGGLRLLMIQAGVLQGVTSIPKGSVIAGGDRLGVEGLTQLGDQLLTNVIYVYVVFVLVLAMIFFEVKWAIDSRRTPPLRFSGWVRCLGVGYLIPAFVGGSALYLIYTAS